jgi:hypothetical protein
MSKNCKCCNLEAEKDSEFCWICLGRGHDEDWEEETTTPNIDDEIDKLMRIAEQAEGINGYGVTPAFVGAVKQLITDARIEAVQELKSRWNDDRKTMDYSPATYQFICDKYIKELKENK